MANNFPRVEILILVHATYLYRFSNDPVVTKHMIRSQQGKVISEGSKALHYTPFRKPSLALDNTRSVSDRRTRKVFDTQEIFIRFA